MLHGDFMGIVPGRGTEPGETRRYEPGDDVRHIDWNVTARMQQPYIRETIADRELETWMLVDRSPRLDFGTASCEKRDLVLGAAAGIGLLTARGGNRVGAMMLRGPHVTTVPPRQGRRNLLGHPRPDPRLTPCGRRRHDRPRRRAPVARLAWRRAAA